MINQEFSFIILTYNEALNLQLLLDSIATLNARIYVLDSGSTDETLAICETNQVQVKQQSFSNHPMQWDAALHLFDIKTPWIIALDADQTISNELLVKLHEFKDVNYTTINGIYFNRKHIFRGQWIRYGGYFPKYLLKMFRSDLGYSDLKESSDHRFQVPGKSIIWKKAYLIEENLKDHNLDFWISKHNTYSNLFARQHVAQCLNPASGIELPRLFRASPNEYNALLKAIWFKLPLYFRPCLYFIYRLVFQLGFLDGKTGILYHFLQGFWFRLVIDLKIEELLRQQQKTVKSSALKFVLTFLILFALLYSFNIFYIGITSPGGIYINFLDQHLNYIQAWRNWNINTTRFILETFGYRVWTNSTTLKVPGFGGFRIVYSCLGYGIMSLFTAFILAYPKSLRIKIRFLISGLLLIQLLNTCRFILISLYYSPLPLGIDHHQLFNGIIYLLLAFVLYAFSNYTTHADRNFKKNV
ncbi:exosortase Y [Pedobacter sp. MC2016-24]|uniref:exosortase Y n=1 Tax=Pedobacter sp. MC2016-24 TaxID=2780090 RepID=UPI001881AA50|nr:glycosyltransferase [Pedobacter sp. MC2016-24]MBE9603071.1 glycosyltransferase [Pedobacter sp. MC2016-24]